MGHKRKSNRRKKRSVKKRLLILCEGETERNYFSAMKEDDEYKSKMAAANINIFKARESAPNNIVKDAIKRKKAAEKEGNPYDMVWLVFDHDNHPHRKKAYDDGRKEQFRIAFSAFCFENWYLLHFKKSGKAFIDADKLIAELKKHYPIYQKAKQNDFENLKDRLLQAMANAAWQRKRIDDEGQHITENNPWTDVDALINYLDSL